jgi:hypothetical protein
LTQLLRLAPIILNPVFFQSVVLFIYFDGKNLMDDLILWPFLKLYDARRIHKGLKEKAIII